MGRLEKGRELVTSGAGWSPANCRRRPLPQPPRRATAPLDVSRLSPIPSIFSRPSNQAIAFSSPASRSLAHHSGEGIGGAIGILAMVIYPTRLSDKASPGPTMKGLRMGHQRVALSSTVYKRCSIARPCHTCSLLVRLPVRQAPQLSFQLETPAFL